MMKKILLVLAFAATFYLGFAFNTLTGSEQNIITTENIYKWIHISEKPH